MKEESKLTPKTANTFNEVCFLDVLIENYQAQIAGFYNDDKTDAERAKRNAVIEEYQDLIAIFKAIYAASPQSKERTVNDIIHCTCITLGIDDKECPVCYPVSTEEEKGKRMFTLEEMKDLWDAAARYDFSAEYGRVPNPYPNKKDYFKQNFNIEI